MSKNISFYVTLMTKSNYIEMHMETYKLPVSFFEALTFAVKAHNKQYRKSIDKTEPYINHPIKVAERLLHALQDSNISDDDLNCFLQAALLHDVVEKTKHSLDEIRDIFGEKTAELVFELTDPSKSIKNAKARRKVRAKRAQNYSLGAANIKVCDKTENLNDILVLNIDWPKNRIINYANEAKDVVLNCKEGFIFPCLLDDFFSIYEKVIREHAQN